MAPAPATRLAILYGSQAYSEYFYAMLGKLPYTRNLTCPHCFKPQAPALVVDDELELEVAGIVQQLLEEEGSHGQDSSEKDPGRSSTGT